MKDPWGPLGNGGNISLLPSELSAEESSHGGDGG